MADKQKDCSGLVIKSHLRIETLEGNPLLRLEQKRTAGKFTVRFYVNNMSHNLVFHGIVAVDANGEPKSLFSGSMPVADGDSIVLFLEIPVGSADDVKLWRGYFVFKIIHEGFDLHTHYIYEPSLEAFPDIPSQISVPKVGTLLNRS